jgi:ATP-dependent RNA helicase DeaD
VSQKSTQENLQDRLAGYIRNAGFRSPTVLQENVLALTLQDRDIVVEAGPGEGRTGLFIISLLMQTSGGAEGVTSLIVTAVADEVYKVMRQYRRFTARLHGRPYLVGLGTDEYIERELRLLSRKPDIVVGTSGRIIDHVRRESVSLANIKRVVLVMPENPGKTGFDKDVQYIYSKLADNCLTQVYCPRLDLMSTVSAVLKKPVQTSKQEWCQADEASGREPKGKKMTRKKPRNS